MGKVDILLATYNGSKYLSEQIESLLAQTYNDIEIIIRDDGSKDGSISIIDAYCKKYKNISVLRDNTQCGSAAKNFSILLDHASADYIMFCDQDDIWLPEKVERTLYEMKKYEQQHPDQGVLIHTDLQVVDENGALINNSFFEIEGIDPDRNRLQNLFLLNPVTGCTTMVNRKLVEEMHGVEHRVAMHDHWMALYASAFGVIGTIREPLIKYRQHSSNVVGAHDVRSIKHAIEVAKKREKYKALVDTSFDMVKIFREKYDSKLSEEQKLLCEQYLSLKSCNAIKKLPVILLNDFYRQSVFQKIKLWICLI